ncbi:MAG: pilus assembly protein PilM [Candidatus Omnitrophica bacterium]|nr:pilus assembly protein PilM [Candidatus Omnitrophota bacterium]
MANALVGLVLRHDAVEVVQLARGLGGTKVVKSARAAVADGNLAAAIRSAMGTAGITAKRVAVALPPQDVLLRAFSIPPIPRSEVDTAVQFEARKYLPFKLTDLVWDYAVVPRSDKQITVIFAAVERAALLRIQESLRAAGLEPLCIEPCSVSLARAVQRARQQPPQRAAAAVNITGDSAHIAIVREGKVYLAREVRLTAEPDASQSSETSDPRAMRLASELRLSMEFFAREFADTPVERVLLFGEPTLVTRWRQELAAGLGCAVESAEGGSLALAVGLALRAADRSAPFDLLRRIAQPRPSTAREALLGHPVFERASKLLASMNRPVLGLCLAAAVAVVALMWMAGARQLVSEHRRLELAVHSRPEVGFGLAGRSQADLEPVRQRLEDHLAFLHRIIEERTPLASKLDALARTVPNGIWLTSLSYQDELSAAGQSQAMLSLQGACFLDGEGPEMSAIREFEETMKRNKAFSEGFSSVQLQEISVKSTPKQRYTYRTFQVHCRKELAL